MTKGDLCRLALAAIHDADAWLVLEDAVQESGPDVLVEQRATPVYSGNNRPRIVGHVSEPVRVVIDGQQWTIGGSPGAGRWEALAIAAVLLFGEWPTRWPLANMCDWGYVLA